MSVDYFEYNVSMSFDTLKEARAFWAGIDWVNDSSIDVGGIEKKDEHFYVRMTDTDADVGDPGKVDMNELYDKFGHKGT